MARRDKREKRDPYGMQDDYHREQGRYRQDRGEYDRRYDQGYDPRYGQNYRPDYRGGYDSGYYGPDDRKRRTARR